MKNVEDFKNLSIQDLPEHFKKDLKKKEYEGFVIFATDNKHTTVMMYGALAASTLVFIIKEALVKLSDYGCEGLTTLDHLSHILQEAKKERKND